MSERRRIVGSAALYEALARGVSVPAVLLPRGAGDDAVRAAEAAREQGAVIHRSSANEMRRLADAAGPVDLLALDGPDPRVPFAEALRRRGAAWLLVDVKFPGNVGFAMRTAEVSGACAIAISPPLAGAELRGAQRSSMGADRLFPVAWIASPDEALDAARAADRRVIAIEDDARSVAPWDADLAGGVLFVLGGERHGLAPDLLARCDAVLRLPMRGFIPAYNVHAAMAAVAAERLRQER